MDSHGLLHLKCVSVPGLATLRDTAAIASRPRKFDRKAEYVERNARLAPRPAPGAKRGPLPVGRVRLRRIYQRVATWMLFSTATTPSTLRASFSALAASSLLLAVPVSVTTPLLSVSTLMLIALTSLSLAKAVFTL